MAEEQITQEDRVTQIETAIARLDAHIAALQADRATLQAILDDLRDSEMAAADHAAAGASPLGKVLVVAGPSTGHSKVGYRTSYVGVIARVGGSHARATTSAPLVLGAGARSPV
jgi:hypothetical protein